MINKIEDRLIQADKIQENNQRISTGIFIFDLLLGGGLPLWKFNIFHGKESSGKTTQSLRVIGNFLKQYKDLKFLYIDIENSFEKNWAGRFVDLKRTLLAQPDYGEEAVDIVKEVFQKDEIGALLIDSLASLVPVADANKSAIEDSYGSIPKLANKLLRKLIPIISQKKKKEIPALIIILNQLTANTEARGFQSPYKKPAGMYQNFVASIDVQFYTKEYKKTGDIPIAVCHQFTIQKAKISRVLAKRSGEFLMALVKHDTYNIGDIIEEEQVLSYAKKAKIFEQKGKSWEGCNEKFNTLADILNKLKTDKEFLNKVKEITLQESLKLIWGNNDSM